MNRSPANAAPVSDLTLLAYALPVLTVGIVTGPITGILPSLYAKHARLSLTAVGTLFLVARIFDAVTDPLIGYWSDQTRSRWGARKPWVATGGVLIALAVFFLFRVPADAGISYFATWALLFYLGSTMFQVPHLAWGGELSTGYLQRSRIFTVRGLFDSCGSLVYALLPILLFQGGIVAKSEFSPDVFRWLGWVVLLAVPATVWIAVRTAPVGELVVRKRGGLRELYDSVRRNRPLLRFLSAYVLAGAGTGFFTVLFFPFFDSQLLLGEKLPQLMLTVFVAALASLPIWHKIIARTSKHRAWACAWIGGSLALLPLLIVEPGGAWLPALACLALFGFMSGASALAPFAVLGDIVDYDTLKTRVDRAGSYYAFVLLIAKVAGSLGGLAFVILGAVFGYKLGINAVNTEAARLGMTLMFCLLPGALQLLAVPLIWNFPIDQHRHEIIRRRLKLRAQRGAAGAGP